MRIYLVQHGESKSEEEDPQRPLTVRGIDEVRQVADFLRPRGPVINIVWHSYKTRAQQTAELLAEVFQARLVERAGLGPNDRVGATKEALEQTGGNLMIVSHMPFLGKLAGLLVTGSEENKIVAFQFGSVLCLECRDDLKWKVAWMITPALLGS
jgi:phosphohistidine phosphatase